MRILITGGAGQLGRALARQFAPHQTRPLGHADLDVTDAECIRRWLADERPDCVVHCAALTDTALCERDPGLADAVNRRGAQNVAEECAAAGVRLVAISTNEVFGGQQQTPYEETAEPAPVNVYGRSKLAGERAALEARGETLILRTSWLYGDGGQNFVRKVIAAGRAGRPLRFVTDEVASPTSCDDVAAAIGQLVERQAPPGIYHLAGDGSASRYEFAREVLCQAGLGEVPIEPLTTSELRASGYDGPPKPPYSVLRNTRAAALGVTLPQWQDALHAYFARTPVRADA